ncbi:hypothetical protein M405DRAFT_806637 [Rhizopogon salebrosus TDB-379]|nr:hypothetical protein M405DRAFT_806637 [Rhizopogon salebrosus TDB-379]
MSTALAARQIDPALGSRVLSSNALIFFAHGSNVVFQISDSNVGASCSQCARPLSSHRPPIIQPASTSEQRFQNELTLSIKQQQRCRERRIRGKVGRPYYLYHALPCHPQALVHHPAFPFSNASANHPMHPADL